VGDLYEEQAVLDMLAFIADATTGIATRIAAIDADQADAYAINATAWTAYDNDGLPRALPAYAVTLTDGGRIIGERGNYQNIYRFPTIVQFALDYAEAAGIPQSIQRKGYRVATAFRQMMNEETAWSGPTLGGRVQDARIRTAPKFGSLYVAGAGKQIKRLIAVTFKVDVDRVILTAKT
jgi:hypothetical protein